MPDKPGEHWDEEAEVVVVGYGGAGAVAAISAHDAGARVVVLEKQPADTLTLTRHTPSTRMSGGAWFCPTSVEASVKYLEAMVRVSNETLDEKRRELLLTFSQYLAENNRWMREIGADLGAIPASAPPPAAMIADEEEEMDLEQEFFPDFPELPGSECSYLYYPKTQGKYRHGAAFFKVLSDNVAKRGIEVLWQTPARGLVTAGGVRGVLASRGRKKIAIKATRAVILTCGGFEYNEEMKENYLRVHPSYYYGTPANTGDGINMALQAGAALWHMNSCSWRVVMKFPDFPVAFSIVTRLQNNGGVFVDKWGRRFCNERFHLHSFGYELAHYNSQALTYPEVPCYWVFDEKRRQAGPLSSVHGPCNPPGGVLGPYYYPWSQDNEAEIERGWIVKAPSLTQLGRKLAQDPSNGGLMLPSLLEETVHTYNLHCSRGEDPQFHRPGPSLAPLADPPYYAVKLWPGGPNTQGGPKRNSRAQVLRPDSRPVPRLYAAGELGSVWGMLYQGGGNIGECIAFGRIAGAGAAAEKPWR